MYIKTIFVHIRIIILFHPVQSIGMKINFRFLLDLMKSC